jgi:hypothetical protein
VGLVRDSSVQSLTVLYTSGLLPTVVSTQGQNILKGGTKHEQRHGDPPESNPVVRRKRIGDKSAAGDGDGGMQRITPWGMKCFSAEEIVRGGLLRSAGFLHAQPYYRVQFDGRSSWKTRRILFERERSNPDASVIGNEMRCPRTKVRGGLAPQGVGFRRGEEQEGWNSYGLSLQGRWDNRIKRTVS